MHCPKCQAEMKAVRYDFVQVDRCTGCHGIWFDLAEQEHLKKIDGSKSIDIGTKKIGKQLNECHDIVCPKCDVKMLAMRDAQQSHIQFEKCGSCHGIFLDAGEFRDLKEKDLSDFFKALMI